MAQRRGSLVVQGSDFIKAQLARRAWLDGADEGLNGMMAVCFTYRNRQRAGWFGGNWVEILSNHRDASSHSEQDAETIPDPRVYSFQCLLQEIDGIFSGARQDDITVAQQTVLAKPPAPALYYGRLDKITNDWFLNEISRRPDVHPRVSQVGMMFFFG